MIQSIEAFTNYFGFTIKLVASSWDHIVYKHPEITLKIISDTLKDPDAVFMSELNPETELYYLQKNLDEQKTRYSVVVVKLKHDGLWISTAMTRRKISSGVEIYRKRPC
jgi:hypothetical protein